MKLILLAVIASSTLLAQAASAAAYTQCLTSVSDQAASLLEKHYSSALGKKTSSAVWGIYGGGQWTNKGFPADETGETVAYATYTIALAIFVDGGRGSSGGYRIDPMVEVRVNDQNCSDVRRIILLHLTSDAKEGEKASPELGASYPLMDQKTVQIYRREILPNLVANPFRTHREGSFVFVPSGPATTDQDGLETQGGYLRKK